MKYFLFVIFFLVMGGLSRAKEIPLGEAVLEPKSGSHTKGRVQFFKKGENLVVKVDIEGTTPGAHGFHLHDKGDCSDKDAKSAGDHYNPFHAHHGSPESKEKHLGDMGFKRGKNFKNDYAF